MMENSNVIFGALVLLVSGWACTSQGPTRQANPYADDYSALTALSQRDQWGTANVHDPAIIKTDSFYYVYSTDPYYMKAGVPFNEEGEELGNVPIRRSRDLVNWEFCGWALDSIPSAAVEHVHAHNNGEGAGNMWAPYVYRHGDRYRLYYSVSAFGANTSYIGMAEADSPEGPFVHKGEVVKTTRDSPMNAIDASVISDAETGRMWMHYGSYFAGLYVLELDPESGLALTPGDQGHLVATRGDKATRIIEAPEILYHPDLKMYFLFVSYEPLFTYYNVRVGRSAVPEGPFLDFFGNDMADSTNNYPILTHSYRFENHPGWSGNAHCGVLNDDGKFYMLHQGRLAPDNHMMQMHVREMKWLSSGWPVVSPQRYAGLSDEKVKIRDLKGTWEVLHLSDRPDQTELWQGQVPGGGWTYEDRAFNLSTRWHFARGGEITQGEFSNWQVFNGTLLLDDTECVLFTVWDWENERASIAFSGILPDGTGIWGKKLQ